MAGRLLITTILCVLGLWSAARAADGEARHPLRLAQNTSDLDRKIAEYSEEIRRNPTGTMAYNERAFAYMEKGYFDRGIADLSKLIELAPNEGQYYRMRGDAYGHTGDYDNAIADYDSWLAFAPNDVTGHHNRGLTYRLKGDYQRAIADFTYNVQRHPDLGMDLLERGATRMMTGDASSAIADFDQTLRVDAHDWEALLLRHFAGNRAGAGGASLSPTVTADYERNKWPWPILAFLTGQASAAEVRAAAALGDETDRRNHLCAAAFWQGENELAMARPGTAKPLFDEATRRCPRLFFEFSLAKSELTRLGN